MLSALALMCALSANECDTTANDSRAIASSIDKATTDERLRALVVVYSYRESRWQTDPIPVSHDSHDLISCGILQMPCAYVASHPDLTRQIRTWLHMVERNPKGLAGVDSLLSRALIRLQAAEALLTKASEGIAEKQGQ
jgi:hypothetical protein